MVYWYIIQWDIYIYINPQLLRLLRNAEVFSFRSLQKNIIRPYKVRPPPQLLVYKALNYSYPPETIFKQVN